MQRVNKDDLCCPRAIFLPLGNFFDFFALKPKTIKKMVVKKCNEPEFVDALRDETVLQHILENHRQNRIQIAVQSGKSWTRFVAHRRVERGIYNTERIRNRVRFYRRFRRFFRRRFVRVRDRRQIFGRGEIFLRNFGQIFVARGYGCIAENFGRVMIRRRFVRPGNFRYVLRPRRPVRSQSRVSG